MRSGLQSKLSCSGFSQAYDSSTIHASDGVGDTALCFCLTLVIIVLPYTVALTMCITQSLTLPVPTACLSSLNIV